MYEEILVYIFVAVIIIFSLSNGGFLLSSLAVIAAFYFVDRTRVANSRNGKRAFAASVLGVIILVVSFAMYVI